VASWYEQDCFAGACFHCYKEHNALESKWKELSLHIESDSVPPNTTP